jgi:hypothetical protein
MATWSARSTIVAGSGLSNFTTFPNGSGIGSTLYDFVVSGSGVDSDYIVGLLGPIGDLHFTSNQNLPVGNSTTASFHNGVSDAGDLYPTTPANGLLAEGGRLEHVHDGDSRAGDLCVDARRLGALGFMTRRRKRQMQ